jgi:hypothetical protein
MRVLLTVALSTTSLTAVACTRESTTSDTTTPTVTHTPGTTAAPITVPATTVPSVPVPTYVDENGFDDHSVPSVAGVAALMALSRPGVGGQAAIKFVIPDLDRPTDAPDLLRVHLLDSNFYSLHDEWYTFRLLNGQPIPGDDLAPITDQQFATMDDLYRWATAQPADQLPLELRFIDDRLYAERYYDLVLHGEPRRYGSGSIVRLADAATGDVRWLIELEYADEVTPEHIVRFFERLERALPAEVAHELAWVVRSPQQESIAEQMQAEQLPYHDRVVRYRDVVPAGTVAVYSEGVAAGRLLYVGEGGVELGAATATDIVVTERVPGYLPPASALVTSEPQTPLAHVNLLARNRAIPNASIVGIHDDAGLRQAARVRAHAIVIADGAGVRIALITRDQYRAWVDAQQTTPVAVPAVDVGEMPLVVDLTELADELGAGGLTDDEIDEWRPVIGGKSAGFLTLVSTPGLTPPPDPLAITVRPYVEHLAPMRDTIAAAITDPALAGSPRARWLTLEGPDDYADTFGSDADADFATEFVAAHPPGTALGDVLAAGGVRAMIEDRPITPATLDEITAVLAATYDGYDVEAGLRFRSSSSVEDIEGFNGAGLYTSYTGYLDPESLPDRDDRDNTIERAMLRAWASYWSFEAYEERSLAQIDHLSGAMGLTVHARFDDELERNNGVVTFTFLPGGDADDAVVEINVQAGSVEVTNPDTGTDTELPEVIRVTRRDGEVTIERLGASTLVADDEQVLDDGAVTELFDQVAAVADVWRRQVNASLTDEQRVEVVVLDYEFKTTEAGWPKLAAGRDPYPARLVLRQVRSLDPGLRAIPQAVRDLPVPRDALARANLVETFSCVAEPGAERVEHTEVWTDPLLAPDMGYTDAPFVVGVAPPADAVCESFVDVASSDRALVELVDNGDAFVIVG